MLWSWLLEQGIHIHFAHRTFQWSNEARGKAAVHCVIIGFGLDDLPNKLIYEYEDIRGEPHATVASNINPYLIDASCILLTKRTRPINAAPRMSYGSMALDDGHLLFSENEYRHLIKMEPAALPLLRPFMGGEEFLNNGKRWCLWLKEASPTLLRSLAPVAERIERVKHYRRSSGRATTLKLASYPALFGEDRQPSSEYLLIPKVSSENRLYLPIGFMSPEVVANGSALVVENASRYEFGVLSSAIHMAWMRYTCGRLESRYQYSSSLVYNNFPWPENPSDKQRTAIETAAQAVLDARAQFPDASLADLYDPVTIPPVLVKAHQQLDVAVDAAYGRKSFRNDAERVAFLFELYQKYISLLPAGMPKRGRKKSVADE